MGQVTQAIICLAMNVYFEARSEDTLGQLAIAEVTLNRVESSKYPDNVCDVVCQRKQFSWTHDGKSDNPKNQKAWEKAQRIALFAITSDNRIVGDDVTHYHATYVQPYWTSSYDPVRTIGKHVFYKQKS